MNGQAFNSSRRMESPSKSSKTAKTHATHITQTTVRMAVAVATVSPTHKITWGNQTKAVINTILTRSKRTEPMTTCGSACSIVESGGLPLSSSPTLKYASFPFSFFIIFS